MGSSGMKLVVVGAAGRMGQALIRLIHQTPGVQLHAAVAREGSAFVGRDAGEIAGLGPIGVEITSDPLQAFLHAEGVIDFTGNQRHLCRSRCTGPHRACHRHHGLRAGR